jgi:peptide-methionine (S)-S-oxide reductase
MDEEKRTDKIVLGGGCFWCVEAVYRRIPGVIALQSGYAGGHIPNPTYREVCSGKTGHAEVVEVQFDPEVISLEQVMNLFWIAHDPTTLNRQGADVGTQYRSVVYLCDPAQEDTVRQSMNAAQGQFKNPIVTEIAELDHFYPAESYHQEYYEANPDQGYCRVVIAPKLEKLGLHREPRA